jgi:hypothetical protein
MLAEFYNGNDKGAHHKFQQWRHANDNGFFISARSSNNVMLHQVLCPHSGNTRWEEGRHGSLTKKKKVCSNSREELLNWARKEGVKLKFCQTCKP